MKKLLLAGFCLLAGSALWAQQNTTTVPTNVQKANPVLKVDKQPNKNYVPPVNNKQQAPANNNNSSNTTTPAANTAPAQNNTSPKKQ